MRFLKLLGKHLPPYKGHLLLYILFTVLTAVFSVFSFSAVIPLLKILFGLSDSSFVHQSIAAGASLSDMMEVLENNILLYIQGQIALKGEAWALLLVGFFIIVTSLVANVCSYFADFFRIPIRTGVLRDVRKKMYSKILYVSNGFLSGDNRGDTVSRMTSDALEYEWCIANTLNMLVKDPIKICVYLITLFTISWRLALLSVGLLSICAVVIAIVGKPIKKVAHRGQSERGGILSDFDETLGNITTIKAYTSENRYSERFNDLNEKNRGTFNLLNRIIALVGSISDFLVMVSMAVLLWVGGSHILNGDTGIGASEFIYFLLVFYSIIKPATDMANSAYGIRKCMASVERIDKIMALCNSSEDPSTPLSIPEGDVPCPLVEFRDVSFGYPGGRKLFNGVSLELRHGETVALVGQTGSGKTTLISLLMRFLSPEDGDILYRGVNIRNLKADDLRNQIGYVSQDTTLFNDTVFNNISIGKEDATKEYVAEAARKAGIHDFIMGLPNGYDTIIGDRGTMLSGGQRQCISIARAILKNAPLLILDEATSALDIKSEKQVQDALQNLMKGRTTLIISHRFSSITSADCLYLLNNGRITRFGLPDDMGKQDSSCSEMLINNLLA